MAIVIQSSFSPARPLTHARLGHATITRGGLLVASGEQAGFEADAALNPLTYEFWKPDALPATWRIDAGAAVSVDYVAIAAHTLATEGASVKPQWSDNDSTWNDVTGVTAHAPANDGPIMFLFAPISHRYWRIQVTGTTVPSIGVVFIGAALAMPRPLYGGHSPLDLSRTTVIRPHQSERGQFLGRSKVRSGFATDIAWRHLTPSFVRSEFDPFVEDATCFPFFLAWRPSTFTDSVGYVWTKQDIHPSNMGIGAGLMQVAFNVEGLGLN